MIPYMLIQQMRAREYGGENYRWEVEYFSSVARQIDSLEVARQIRELEDGTSGLIRLLIRFGLVREDSRLVGYRQALDN